MLNINKQEFLNAKKFFEIVEDLFENGIEYFPNDLSIGTFQVMKGDLVDEQYQLMLDYFQEKGKELVFQEADNDMELERN